MLQTPKTGTEMQTGPLIRNPGKRSILVEIFFRPRRRSQQIEINTRMRGRKIAWSFQITALYTLQRKLEI
jgi:hypothetical protein